MTFALSENDKAWWERRLYKKGFVFYSYFLLILFVSVLSSYAYNRIINKFEMEDYELNALLENYRIKNNDNDEYYDEIVTKIEQEYQNKIQNIRDKYSHRIKHKNIAKDEYNKRELDQIKKEHIRQLEEMEVKYKKNLEKQTSLKRVEPVVTRVDSINGFEHITELKNTLQNSSHSVFILSGWVTSFVMTPEMIKIFNDALGRGVDIYIGFGYGSIAGTCHKLRALNPEQRAGVEALLAIKRRNKRNGIKGTLNIGYFPTHQKILLKDDEFVICGSNNWLSNAFFNNHETSFKVFSKQLLTSERERIKALVMEYEIHRCL